MRREYCQNQNGVNDDIPFKDSCIFFAPLSFNGDMQDKVSKAVGTIVDNTRFAWSETMNAYQIHTTTGGQRCLTFTIPDRFNLSPSYNYTIYADVYVESFSGTCDFLQLGSGTSGGSNAVALGETHRWTNFTTNNWHNLAMVVNGDDVFFYMDSALVRTDKTSTFSYISARRWYMFGDSQSVISIGGGFNSYNYTAYVKNVFMFNRALTIDELRTLSDSNAVLKLECNGNPLDSSIYQHQYTIVGAPQYVDGCYLQGVSNSGNKYKLQKYANYSDWVVRTRIYPTAYAENGLSKIFASEYTSSVSRYAYIDLGIDVDGKLRMENRESNGSITVYSAISPSALSLNCWHDIEVRRINNVIKFIIDGVQVLSQQFACQCFIQNITDNFTIGNSAIYQQQVRYFHGMIDYLTLWIDELPF